MDRHTGKWARRQGISCYRVYDADLPSHPLVIDRYADWVHLAEYKRDVELDEHEYRTWRFPDPETITEVMDAGFTDRVQGTGPAKGTASTS